MKTKSFLAGKELDAFLVQLGELHEVASDCAWRACLASEYRPTREYALVAGELRLLTQRLLHAEDYEE